MPSTLIDEGDQSPKKERKRPLKEEKPVVEPVKPESKVVPKQEEEEQEFEFPDEIELPSTITAVEEKKNDEEMKKPSPLKVEPKIVYLKKALFDLLDDSSPSSETRKSPSSKERDRNKTLSKQKSISFG